MKKRFRFQDALTRPTGLSSERVDTRPTSLYSQEVEFERKKRRPKSPKPAHGPASDVAASSDAPAVAAASGDPLTSTVVMPLRSAVAERILRTADELFYREGVRAVGIQRVIDEAGIAKASLYAHYESKDDLVAACMERRGQATRAALTCAMSKAPDNPRAKLLALFDFQREAVTDPGFHGCPVQKAHAELLAETDHPARRVTAAHRQWLLDLFAGLVKETGVTSPDYVAGALLVLFDGAIATTMVDSNPNATRYARLAAEQIIDAHLPKASR
jgi:AcrR family transcriptional regulator